MFRKSIAAVISAVMLLSIFAAFTVSAENTVNDAAVSGYVSMTNENGGLELAGADKVPTIYVDDSDFEGVVRAVDDLKDDIKTVTGVTGTITNKIKSKFRGGNVDGISISDDGMYVILTEAVAENAECYIAVYGRGGILTNVVKADRRLNDEHIMDGFEFDTVLQKPAGGDMKAFIWRDMEPVTDVKKLQYSSVTFILDDVDVIVGTVGESEVIDNLAQNERLDVSEIEGQWESFTIQNVDNTLVIAGSDKRGTIYGVYDLCEKIGVSPWNFWADTVSGHADNLYINLPDGGYTEGEPSVQYRGIFLNDEFNMSEWSKSMGTTGKNMNNETYEKIFELLLRLKANYLWPAMHTYSTAFNVTENNAALADKYGIVMGSSHAEPLLRNNLGELYDYQEKWKAKAENAGKALNTKTADGKTTIKDDANRTVAYMWTDKDNDGNAVSNKEFLTDYWRARAKANSNYENTYTLGMRGVHDGGFSTNMNSQTAMKEILETQTQILKDEVVKTGQDISDIPQVFIPYKEMLDMYNKGLEIPDYVTLMWPDDNFGYIRQLPTETERQRSGGAGIYYHLSYYGRPTSYLWLSTTSPAQIREEMTKAYDMGAQKIWIANVGDLKPAETEIEYFLDLARDIDTIKNTEISDWLAENAKRDFAFDDVKAAEYSDIKMGYYKNTSSKRPEHFVKGLFSTEFGDEGQKLVDNYNVLERRAQTLYDSLSEDKKPSFYELMLYPLKGAKNMAEKYVYSDKANCYAEMGYGAAVNKYAKLSDDAYQRVVEDTAEYTSMLNGKWDKMMNPYQTRLTGSFGGTITGKLSNPEVSQLPYTNMEIAAENNGVLSFTKYSTEAKYIDIINTGTGSFEWTAETSADWININKTSGIVADDDRIYVGIDTLRAGNGESNAEIIFRRRLGGADIQTASVTVTFENADVSVTEEKTYIENDGYVSIEAEHYSNSVKNGEYEWRVEKDFGRNGGSVKIYPDTAAAVSVPNKNNSAYLEYDVYFTSAGTFPIDVYRMPTLNELSGAAMRCNIGIDDNTPVRFSGTTGAKDKSDGTDSWGRGVLQNTEVVSGTITVPSVGLHKIRLYNESAGVVVDKFVITTGEKKTSYFGAPESYNTTYNNAMKPLPAPSVATEEQTGNITPLFDPLMMITDITTETEEYNGEIYTNHTVPTVALKDFDIGFFTFVIASYDKDGNMIDAAYTSHGNSMETGEYLPFEVLFPSTDGAETIQCMIVRGDVDYETGEILTENWEPLAPVFEQKVSENGVSAMASYDNGCVYPASRMSEYIGKESVCVISEEGNTNISGIKYIRQNTVKEDTYNKIPFNGEGRFDLKIKVAGVNDIISERFSTVKNISTDTEPSVKELYNWGFDTNQTGTGNNVPVLGGNAIYDSANKCVKLTPTAKAGGNLGIEFDGAVTAAQGEKITVVSKIAYGNLSGKYMTYELTDSNGNMLIRSKINRYTGKTQSLTIGGVEQLTDNAYPSAIQKIDNTATTPNGKFSVYTAVIDPASNEIVLTISNTVNSTVNEYRGKLPEGTSYDLKKIYFTTDYDNAGRSCYVDDISVTKSKAASYTISFIIPDGAVITVEDAVTGAVIAAEADGTFKLCDGLYNYTVISDGKEIRDTLELSPATESKDITVKMN